eukprot:6465348-Amphidinium_carterae.1
MTAANAALRASGAYNSCGPWKSPCSATRIEDTSYACSNLFRFSAISQNGLSHVHFPWNATWSAHATPVS